MNLNSYEDASNLEALVRTAAEPKNEALMRTFACECCRRISNLCADAAYSQLLAFAETRASGSETEVALASLRSEADRLYSRLYPGYGSPSAAALALTAAGEAAFTESPLDAAINASATAAMAVAEAAAATVEDDRYDEAYEAAYQAEQAAQIELWMRLLSGD